jgi:hypothetical protein
MIIDYDTRNCPFCCQGIIGKWQTNDSLPIGEKITTIDRFSSDSRTKIFSALKKRYGGRYLLPIVLSIDEREAKTFGEAIERRRSFIILSVLDCFHLKAFFKHQKDLI